MNITAEAVKQLRERTGAGMMECKKALVETKGDLDAAAELMRKQGLAKADKKAARVAAEGVVVIEKSADARTAAMVEINCETDFVARVQDFLSFARAVAARALTSRPASLQALLEMKLQDGQEAGESIEERRRSQVAEIGDKMVEGRLRKSLSEITLTGQPFVKDPDVTIEKLLKGAQAQVVAFER